MDLYEIVTGRMLRPDLTARIVRPVDRVAVHRWSGRNQTRTKHLALKQRLAELEMRGTPEHAAYRCHTVCNEQTEGPVEGDAACIRHVGVHFGQPRNQITIGTIDD